MENASDFSPMWNMRSAYCEIFLVIAYDILSAIIAFIQIWAFDIISIRSLCFGSYVAIIGSRIVISKTTLQGTSPFSPIVSFINYTATFRSLLSLTEGKYIFNLLKILRNGSWSLSPIPSELCARVPKSQISILVLLDSLFYFSDVYTGPWSDLILFGYPV